MSTIKIKRSAVAAKVPTTGDMVLGELAINTYDGKLYMLKNDGSDAVVEIGASAIGQSVSEDVVASSGTTSIPWDSTTPLASEGTEIVSATITPGSVDSTIDITCAFSIGASTQNAQIIATLFRGSTCIDSQVAMSAKNNIEMGVFAFDFDDTPATTSATTYSIRIGVTSGTWYVNQGSGGETLGGTLESQIHLREIIG